MSIYYSRFSQDKKFYTYHYLRSKPSQHGMIGTPYYVGKGQNDRAYRKHQKGIFRPNAISDIVISSLMTEADAFQVEMLQIYMYGRIDTGTGCLRNHTDGGDGPSGYIRSEESTLKTIATKKIKGNLNCRTPAVVMKSMDTRRRNGTVNTTTPESIAKSIATKLQKYGNKNNVTPESDMKRRTTMLQRYGTLTITNAESIAKGKNTKKEKGISLGGTSTSAKKGWETRRKNLIP